MAITLAEVFAGPAELWIAAVGTAEPEINAAPGVGWRDVGGTTGGITFSVEQSLQPITFDQIAAEVGALPENQTPTISTTLGQASLENYLAALNGGAITNVPAAVGPPAVPEYDEYEPENDLVNNPLTYHAILMRGKTMDGKTGQAVLRRTLNTANSETAFSKTAVAGLSVAWRGYYVSASIPPFAMRTEAAA